MGEVDAV